MGLPVWKTFSKVNMIKVVNCSQWFQKVDRTRPVRGATRPLEICKNITNLKDSDRVELDNYLFYKNYNISLEIVKYSDPIAEFEVLVNPEWKAQVFSVCIWEDIEVDWKNHTLSRITRSNATERDLGGETVWEVNDYRIAFVATLNQRAASAPDSSWRCAKSVVNHWVDWDVLGILELKLYDLDLNTLQVVCQKDEK